MNLASQVRFEQCDVSKKLPFDKEQFDALFVNDVFCHVPDRAKVLAEVYRILKPDGRILFSDAVVVGGMVSHGEIATRSSIGFCAYSPPGENAGLMERAGFCRISATDTTENAAQIAKRWSLVRAKRKDKLVTVEDENNFEGLQRFLSCVHILTSERRLLRYLHLASKQA